MLKLTRPEFKTIKSILLRQKKEVQEDLKRLQKDDPVFEDGLVESIIVGIEDERDLEKGRKLMEEQKYVSKLYVNNHTLYVYIKEGEKLLPEILRLLDRQKISIQTIELSRPSLDDVFLQHTGRTLREGGNS